MNVKLTRWYPTNKYLPKRAGWYLVSSGKSYPGDNSKPGQFFWFDPRHPKYFWFSPGSVTDGPRFNCFLVANNSWCGVKK